MEGVKKEGLIHQPSPNKPNNPLHPPNTPNPVGVLGGWRGLFGEMEWGGWGWVEEGRECCGGGIGGLARKGLVWRAGGRKAGVEKWVIVLGWRGLGLPRGPGPSVRPTAPEGPSALSGLQPH